MLTEGTCKDDPAGTALSKGTSEHKDSGIKAIAVDYERILAVKAETKDERVLIVVSNSESMSM